MAVRIKTKFRGKDPKSVEDRASVVASNVWKIAQETCRRMEMEGYRIGDDRQVTAVLTEIIAFLVQIADRIAYGQLSEADRFVFVNAIGRQLARLVDENLAEFIGPGDYAKTFVDTLNARFTDYAEFGYAASGPSYAFLRYLGERVADVMSGTDNKWVKERVIDIEAPEAVKLVKRVVHQVMGVKVA